MSNVSISSETDHSSEESADEASSSDETDANASWTRSWESDRMNDKSSMQILVEWVVSEDNYARWNNIRQDGPAAIENLCNEILHLLLAQGISHRSVADIRQAIQELEEAMAKTYDMLSQRDLRGTVLLRKCEPAVQHAILYTSSSWLQSFLPHTAVQNQIILQKWP